jgi:membrane protein DedA with SNARE-associated domain
MLEFLSPDLARALQELINYFIKLVENGGYLTVYITMTIESMIIPLPSEVVMPFAGYLVHLGRLNFWLVGLVASLANLTGSAIAYFIGYYGGRPLVRKYGKYILLRQSHVDRAERFFDRYGAGAVFIGRLLPLVRSEISLPAGFARMHFGKFLLYTFLGSLPWNYALTFAGFALGDNWETILGITRYIDIIIVAAVLGLIIWFIVHRVRRMRKDRNAGIAEEQ